MNTLQHDVPPPGVALKSMSVTIDGTAILTGVNLCARPGRIHALVGRNGAGKSTAFKAILGLIPATGSVRILGEDLHRGVLTQVGSSINGPAYYGHASARTNVRIHTKVLGLPDAEADRVLGVVGLADVGRKKARAFSTGMKARLALAIALVGSPRVLILDEPHNGLDPQGIADLRLLLRQYADQGNTVIVSSHQLGEVAKIADDITVIDGGTTVYSGSAAQFAGGGDLEDRFLTLTGGGQ